VQQYSPYRAKNKPPLEVVVDDLEKYINVKMLNNIYKRKKLTI